MIKDQCISVTDLRTRTKPCLDRLEQGPKYVFLNNKPVAVLLDVDEYEQLVANTKVNELSNKEVTLKMKDQASKAKETPLSQLQNL